MKIPRIVIAATQSSSGKTTIVTGLLAELRSRGLKVQSFKVGPDYIDPGYHKLASGRTAHNLDTWLVPKAKLPQIFAAESVGADIAVIEGVMGLYDGGRGGISSTAEIAKLLDAPVLLVIDCKSMGASAAAIAKGFRDYDEDIKLAGVILNKLGSDTHEEMIKQAMQKINMPVYGSLRRNTEIATPERHLGLLPVEENNQLFIEKMRSMVSASVDVDGILALANRAAAIKSVNGDIFSKDKEIKCTIGIAKDEAFSFYYSTSLAVLENLGARIVPFSPLHDKEIPPVDGIIIGGGFPEMFAAKLAANTALRESLKCAAENNMPIYAECGGYMYLMQSIVDFSGHEYKMAGIFDGQAQMTKKLQMVGYVEAELTTDSVIGKKGTKLHGHEFHFSIDDQSIENRPFCFTKLRNNASYLAGQAKYQTIGSYLHLHFAGASNVAESFVQSCTSYKLTKEK